jgi:D-alanyl-D-alanine carboxypeptidase (penicillin-binding protein 5/6)
MVARKQKKSHKLATAVIIILVVVVALGGFMYQRPLPALAADSSAGTHALPQTNGTAELPWPDASETAVGTLKGGVLATHGAQTPHPTASLAKIMTALMVLHKYPLSHGEQGPTITLTKKDVAYFNTYYAKDGSLVAIKAGEKISEYKALEAMLLPSANNMAESLAVWAYGSVDDYAKHANQMAGKLGMTHTHIADASGFSPKTVASASDLIKLGQAAMNNPVLAKIVGERISKVPVAGTIYNVNYLVGRHGINGIKTGNTEQAGGNYLFAATIHVKGEKQPVQLIGCVMGAPNITAAIKDGPPLIAAAPKNFVSTQVVHKGQSFGSYVLPWSGKTVKIVAAKDANLFSWRGAKLTSHINLQPIQGQMDQYTQVGTVTIGAGEHTTTIPLVINKAVSPPSTWWRLTHL